MNKLLAVGNATLALIMAGGVTFQSLSDREQVLLDANRDLENVTRALAQHTEQTLTAIDLGLRTVLEQTRTVDLESVTVAADLYPLLFSRQAGSITTFSYYIVGPDGILAATSRTPDPLPNDSSDNLQFSVHRDGSVDGLYVSEPRLGGQGGALDRWVLNLTRRITRPDGSFGGIVGASLSIDYLLDFYGTLNVLEQGSVGILSREGRVLVRSPFDPVLMGADFSLNPRFLEVEREHAVGVQADVYLPLDIETVSAFRYFWNDGLIAFSNVQEAAVLAQWRQRVLLRASVASTILLLLVSASLIAAFYSNRRQRWEEENSRRLKLQADASAALVRATNPQSLLEMVTRFAAELIDAHQIVTRLTESGGFRQQIRAIRLSDKYAQWQDSKDDEDRSGIYNSVCQHNQSLLLTQDELQAHLVKAPAAARSDNALPMRGCLAVPIVSHDGGNLGLIQLSDKCHGDFGTDDLHALQQLAAVTGIAADNLLAIAAREEALQQVTAAKLEIESIFTSISDGVYALDPRWRFVYMNAEAELQLERSAAEVMGKVIWDEFPAVKQTVLYGEFLRARRDQTPVNFEFFYPSLQGWYSVRAYPHTHGLTVYFQNITRRVETDERLRQAQKMDAIGQLTGGVAHDFNNLLTVILGNADAVEEYLVDAPGAVRQQAEVIRKAGERAAELTHRLLAFARRQPLDPRRTNINELIVDVEGLLLRTLGAGVAIELVPGNKLWQAVVDPHELENAILNLAINARDAMPEGGRLTIETANMEVDQNYADMYQIHPGQYVLIAVSDTGAGMSAAVMARAFDPFFTTKADGKGSGLGLSMAYGFARQSGGHLKIYSETDQGTTVKLYLPRAVDHTEKEYRRAPGSVELQRGTERILVVEDDDLVRRHTVESLRRLGYTVTECADGPEAMALLTEGEVFDMLLTDVVLAGGMSGKQVAVEALAMRPGLKLLYMSGYTENAIVHHGRLDRGVALLSKPFRLADIARKVRDVLDA